MSQPALPSLKPFLTSASSTRSMRLYLGGVLAALAVLHVLLLFNFLNILEKVF